MVRRYGGAVLLTARTLVRDTGIEPGGKALCGACFGTLRRMRDRAGSCIIRRTLLAARLSISAVADGLVHVKLRSAVRTISSSKAVSRSLSVRPGRRGPLPSIAVADALLDERRELTGLPA